MAIDDVYLLTVSGTQFSSLRQNTLAFRATTTTEPTTADFLTIGNAFKEITRGRLHTSAAFTTYRARQIAGAGVVWPETGPDCTPTGGSYFEGLLTGNLAGTNGGSDALPPQCSMVFTLRSGTVGRAHRGRVYHWGFAEANQTGGVWGGVEPGEINTAWQAFLTTYSDATPATPWRLGVWSQVIASGCKRLPDGTHVRVGEARPEEAFTEVTSVLQRTTVFTQRRRVSGVGL